VPWNAAGKNALPQLFGPTCGTPLGVPDQILSAVFPELRLYGFRRAESWFPKLLSILEEGGATGLGEAP
jgi:hypothetical protein